MRGAITYSGSGAGSEVTSVSASRSWSGTWVFGPPNAHMGEDGENAQPLAYCQRVGGAQTTCQQLAMRVGHGKREQSAGRLTAPCQSKPLLDWSVLDVMEASRDGLNEFARHNFLPPSCIGKGGWGVRSQVSCSSITCISAICGCGCWRPRFS
jgi:hypothetical protein